MLVPVYFIWNLNLPIRQHVLVCSLFALSLVVVIAGIFRTILFYHLTSVFDKTWAAYWVYISSEVELYTGIVSVYSTLSKICSSKQVSFWLIGFQHIVTMNSRSLRRSKPWSYCATTGYFLEGIDS